MPVPEGISTTKVYFIDTGINTGKIVGIAKQQNDMITIPRFQDNGCDIGTLRFICNAQYESITIDIKEWIGHGYINKIEGHGAGMGKRERLFFIIASHSDRGLIINYIQ